MSVAAIARPRPRAYPIERDQRRLLSEGEQRLTFLGVEFERGDALFIASFLTETEEEEHYVRMVLRNGRPMNPFPIISLWRGLGAPFYDMAEGRLPREMEWRPYIGRKLWVVVNKEIGPSGREFAIARFRVAR
jgi:hypothetical protein